MNFLIKLKNGIIRSFNSSAAIMILSFILAIILWFVISISIYPTTPKTFSNITLEVDITGTSAEENDLSVIRQSIKNVTVTVKGDRSRIGSLKPEDLIAKAAIENVTSPCEKSFEIKVESRDPDIEFEVTELKPEKVTVMFDKIDTKEFDLSVNAPNVTAAEGLYMDSDEFTVTPSTVEISGPSTILDRIENAQIYVDTKQEIDAAYSFHSKEIVLFDKNEVRINMDNLSINSQDFMIEIPVYLQKELDLTYDLRYAPANFDTDSLDFEFSSDKISLASPNTDLESIDTWNIGSIPLYDLDFDFSKSFYLEIPSNYKNLSNISTVNVKLNTEGLAKKTVTVNDISILNAPSDYDCVVNTNELTFDIIGPAADLEEITEKDILVTADLLKYTVQSDVFTADVTVSFPNYDKVWAVGIQKISVIATPVAQPQSGETVQPTE